MRLRQWSFCRRSRVCGKRITWPNQPVSRGRLESSSPERAQLCCAAFALVVTGSGSRSTPRQIHHVGPEGLAGVGIGKDRLDSAAGFTKLVDLRVELHAPGFWMP